MRVRRTSTRAALVGVALVGSLGLQVAPAHAAQKASNSAKASKSAKPSTGTTSRVTLLGSPQDRLIRAVVADLDAFWARELPKLYGTKYVPLSGGYRASSPAVLPPVCGRASVGFDDVRDNAFYCRASDYVTWDDEGLFPELASTYGDASIALVLAHESVHAIQIRAKVTLPDVYVELQADCFAGAWFRQASSTSTRLRFEATVLDDAMRSVLAFRDAPGSDASSEGAHGNGFDRISAFQDGYEKGASRCARFPVDRPRLTTASFRSGELETGGDVSVDEALALVQSTGNSHFSGLSAPVSLELVESTEALRGVLRACPDGFSVAGSSLIACPSKSTVTVDRARLDSIYPAVRDGGVAYAVVQAWAALDLRASRPGLTDSTQFTIALQCLGGSWLASVFDTKPAALSPGDLDEAIAAAVGLGPKTLSGPTPQVSGYDRVKAMRRGFDRGASVCRE